MKKVLDSFFKLEARGTSVAVEFRAGIATFLTMAYILFVNPSILANAGMSFESSVAATAIAAAASTLVMGLFSNLPIAMAPGMGLNAVFAFTICGAMGIGWQVALGIVFIEGVLNTILAFTRGRDWIVDAIPEPLKIAIAAGIGLLLAFLGLQHMGVVVDSPATLVALGKVMSAPALAGLAGLIAVLVMSARRLPGAILVGAAVATALGIMTGASSAPATWVAAPPDPRPVLGALDVRGALDPKFIGIIVSLMFMDLFDSLGTLLAVARPCGVSTSGKDPEMRRALRADAVGTVLGAIAGTSSTTSYIESAAGVTEGGRTGLTAVFVSILFLLALPFHPLLAAIPPFATGAVLVAVGLAMMAPVRDLDFLDPVTGPAAFLALIVMPFTFSISTGIGISLAAYVLLAWGAGRGKELHPVIYPIVAIFAATLFIG